MYGQCVDDAQTVTKADAEPQTSNGDADSASGAGLTGWVAMDENGQASFSLADAAACRTAGASKVIPGFDVIDYGQGDYVFGSAETDDRHWSKYVAQVFAGNADALPLMIFTCDIL